MRPGAQPQRILTVSELTLLVRDRLEQGFPEVWIEGEISTLRSPASGHLYFTLKDAQCQIRTVLFRSQAQRLRFTLREGLQVVVRGRLTVYEPRGEYQVVLDYLEPKGVGALQLALEQLKEKLAREGLFVGISSGGNLAGALRVARGASDAVVVVIFPDGGEKYLSERFWDEAKQ